jgi:hypothetical protein
MSEERGTAAANAAPADLQRSVEQMTQLVAELREAEKTVRRRSILVTLLLVSVIMLFGVMTYNKVRDNFTQEKMQRAATERAKLLLPQLQPHIQATVNEVIPYYRDMGKDRLRTFGPKLDARVKDQADRLGQELEMKINAQVEASFGRIMNTAMVQLAKDFPAIAQDGGARATERLKAAMTEETGKLAQHTRNLYQTQSQRIAGTLSNFPVPDVCKTDMDILQRQLLHELLMLADYELTAQARPAPSPSPAPAAALSVDAKR